jgi:hypothetical protein
LGYAGRLKEFSPVGAVVMPNLEITSLFKDGWNEVFGEGSRLLVYYDRITY